MNVNSLLMQILKKQHKQPPGYATKVHKLELFFVQHIAVKVSEATGRGVNQIYVDIFSAHLDVSYLSELHSR